MKEVKLWMDEPSRVIKKLAQELLKRLNERYELFPVITQLQTSLQMFSTLHRKERNYTHISRKKYLKFQVRVLSQATKWFGFIIVGYLGTKSANNKQLRWKDVWKKLKTVFLYMRKLNIFSVRFQVRWRRLKIF